MIDRDETIGPFILWFDYGVEGWRPKSYLTLKEALEADRGGSHYWLITKKVEYVVFERKETDPLFGNQYTQPRGDMP
jgi:hypothetical protein